MTLDAQFVQFSRQKLVHQYWPRLRACVESLTDDQVWWRPNERSNSIGNLLLHLDGNVRQWLVTAFVGNADGRDRAAEFGERQPLPAPALLARLEATLQQADAVMAGLTPDTLTAPRTIQGFQVSGLYAVYHVVEHFSTHLGQIVYLTKWLRDDDLGFYRNLDATGRAEQVDAAHPSLQVP